MEEVKMVINQSSSNKAPGMDRIPAEIYRVIGSVALQVFYGPSDQHLGRRGYAQDFKDATVVPLFKDSKADCRDHQEVSLLSTAGGVWHMLFRAALPPAFQRRTCWRHTVVSVLTETPSAWFLLLDSSKEVCQTGYGSVCHLYGSDQGIWSSQCRGTLGYAVRAWMPERMSTLSAFIMMTELVLFSPVGCFSDSFAISNSVEQGCVLAPVLFNLFFICVLTHAVTDLDHRVYLRYWLNGTLFGPQASGCKEQDTLQNDSRSTICQWLCPDSIQEDWSSACGHLWGSLSSVWLHYQSRKDWSIITAAPGYPALSSSISIRVQQ